MNFKKCVTNILVLFLVLSCTISMAAATDDEPNDSYRVVHANDDRGEEDSRNEVKDDGDLSADKIYSEDYVLGQKKGDGKLEDLIDVDQYIATISAFDVLWAIIMLAFAIVGGAIIIGYVGVILWNAVKKIIASKGENAEQAVNEIKKINQKDTSVSIGVGFSFVLIAVAMFLLSFL